MSQRSEILHRDTLINIFQRIIYRLHEAITVWAVEGGGAILSDHPVSKLYIFTLMKMTFLIIKLKK